MEKYTGTLVVKFLSLFSHVCREEIYFDLIRYFRPLKYIAKLIDE